MLWVEMLPWNQLKTEITAITDQNPSLTPYQSWDYLNITGKGFTARHPQKMLGLRSRTFCLYRGDQAVAIAPLLQQGNTLCLRGQFTGAGNLDFIYRPDFSYDEFSFFMDAIRKRCGNARWNIDRVSEKSLLLDYWQRYTARFPDVAVTKETCVEIRIRESYDAWYHSLSKSVRQNLRTSYNRANTDGRQIDVQMRYDCQIPSGDFKEILQVASKRAVEYGGHKQKWLWRVYYPLKRMDPVIRYLRKCEHCFYGTVRIDGHLAASLIGLYAGDGRMIIPRLSYDSAYYRYSPGGMLVDGAMKSLMNADSPRMVRSLDLSRGEERYKYDFGGKEHFNYCFTFSDSQ